MIKNKHYKNNFQLLQFKQRFHSCSILLKDWPLIKQSRTGIKDSPYTLAMKYIKAGYIITVLEVNNVLAFLDVVISQDTLDEILSYPRLKFQDLSENTIKTEKFLNTIGTVRNERCKAGVYIWTLISTGDMYVGSSTSLARRLIGYFKGTHVDTGKFIPLLRKEGINAFNL